MQGLCRAQRLALYALCHGTGTVEEWLRHQERVAAYEAILSQQQQQSVAGSGSSGVSRPIVSDNSVADALDDHYHDVAHFTVQDVHDHLEKHTDITWQYATTRKPDVWV